MSVEVTVWIVLLAALLTALATGLGVLPFLFVPHMGKRWLGLANAIAGGVMLAASVALIREGVAFDATRVAIGAVAGLVFIVLVRALVGHRHELEFGALRGADALKAFMIVAVMTAHSFTEGVGVGVSYGGGEDLGGFITAAIAVHNIPEGLAIGLVLVPRGVAVLSAAGWAIFSSLPQPLMAVPAFVFVETFDAFLPVGLGFAAGAMIWMVCAELVPDALRAAPARAAATAGILAFGAMMIFQEWAL
jgi:zinc transporter ZupT